MSNVGFLQRKQFIVPIKVNLDFPERETIIKCQLLLKEGSEKKNQQQKRENLIILRHIITISVMIIIDTPKTKY